MPTIFDHSPSDWRELEVLVSQAFAEMGYKCERASKLNTVRGTAEIDVRATKTSAPIPIEVLCECKHWNKLVPQSVVQGFRSVCADAGAHIGLIISKSGFQRGAESSRTFTNIHLLDFESFQRTFFREWQSGAYLMLNAMRDQLLPIFRASSGITENGLDTVRLQSLEGVDVYNKYSLYFGQHSFHSNHFVFEGRFPYAFNDPRGDPKLITKIVVKSHREYLEIAREGLVQCMKRFSLPTLYFSEDGNMPNWPWK